MKFLLHYFLSDFKSLSCKKVSVECRQDLLNFGVELFKTLSDNIELVLLEDGTKICDDENLSFMDDGTDLLIYQKSDSKYYDLYFFSKILKKISFINGNSNTSKKCCDCLPEF